MAEAPKDPFALWRELVGQWEKSVNAAANQTMGSEQFSRSMHGALGGSLQAQETMRTAMAAYLASLNLPSRADVAAIGERLDRIIALLERQAGPAAQPEPPAKPPRTKRPPGEPAA